MGSKISDHSARIEMLRGGAWEAGGGRKIGVDSKITLESGDEIFTKTLYSIAIHYSNETSSSSASSSSSSSSFPFSSSPPFYCELGS